MACLLLMLTLSPRTAAANFVVTSDADAGPGSLREAILQANASPGPDAITFQIPSTGPVTILPLTELPSIFSPVAVNGYTQPGSRANTLALGNDARLMIRLDGSLATNGIFAGLRLQTSSCEIRGLCIVNFGHGLYLDGGQSHVIAGNWIGLDLDNLPSGNTFQGINIYGQFGFVTRHRIGGSAPADRNVISGNSTGIELFPDSAAENVILGNYIGTDASGTLPRGNTFQGIMVQSPRNTIGGTSQVEANVISDNMFGIEILGQPDNRIVGNRIGTDCTGRYALGNDREGIMLQATARSLVGGKEPGAGNIIANNRGHGIHLFNSTDSRVHGNWIGTDPSRQRVMGNLEHGIFISGDRNRIGDLEPGGANTVAYSGKASIGVASGTRNSVRGNALLGHRELALDLQADGITPNDPLDPDTGPNQLLNHPTLTSGEASPSGLRVQGILQAAANTLHHVDVYVASAPMFPGHAQADVFLGTLDVVTPADGSATFAATFAAPVQPGSLIAAFATDPQENTSECSEAVVVSGEGSAVALTLERSGSHLLLRWPLAAIGFQLQQTSTLNPSTSWISVTCPILPSGDFNTCTLPPESLAPAAFFRLTRHQ